MKKDMIVPMQDKILVKRSEPKNMTDGGLLIPEIAQEETQFGTVVAVGPGRLNNKGIREKMSVKINDKVYFTKNAVIDVVHNGSDHLMMKEERVLLVAK